MKIAPPFRSRTFRVLQLSGLLILLAGLSGCKDESSTERKGFEADRITELERRLEEQERLLRERDLQMREQNLANRETTLVDEAAELERQRRELGNLLDDQDDRARELAEAAEALEKQKQTPPPITMPVSGSRDDTYNYTPPPSQGNNTYGYDVFFDGLDPYGDWVRADDYGYVWQPEVIRWNPRWRPYTDGHWIYTDRGWYWETDEPFGWATYHYGRWVCLQHHGWVWVPGETWAPAWVSWHTAEQYVGWAPMPPQVKYDPSRHSTAPIDADAFIGPAYYNFIATQHMGHDRYDEYYFDRQRNWDIIKQTRNVSRYRPQENRDQHYVVIEGPDYDHVHGLGNRPMPVYNINQVNHTDHGGNMGVLRPTQIDRKQNLVQIFAPILVGAFMADRLDSKPRHTVREVKQVRTVDGRQRSHLHEIQQADQVLVKNEELNPENLEKAQLQPGEREQLQEILQQRKKLLKNQVTALETEKVRVEATENLREKQRRDGTKPEPSPVPVTKPQSVPNSDPRPESKPDLVPRSKPEPSPTPTPEPQPDPSPTPTPEPQPEPSSGDR